MLLVGILQFSHVLLHYRAARREKKDTHHVFIYIRSWKKLGGLVYTILSYAWYYLDITNNHLFNLTNGQILPYLMMPSSAPAPSVKSAEPRHFVIHCQLPSFHRSLLPWVMVALTTSPLQLLKKLMIAEVSLFWGGGGAVENNGGFDGGL